MNDLLFNGPYSGKDFFNFVSTVQLPRHRWYFFKEGFSFALVKEAIRNYSSNAGNSLHILDPFCGCGTTALTASLMGHHCTSIEVNPFLKFTSQVKTVTSKFWRKSFIKNLNEIINSSTNGEYSPLENYSTFSERPNLSKWLFNKSVLRRFHSLMNSNNKFGGYYRDVFKLAAIVAAIDCCNAKRDGKALRYKKNWKELGYSSKDFISQFHRYALMMIDDIETHPIKSEYRPNILLGDSRELLSDIEDQDYDLIVTSPPYLNSFDYSDVYRPELFLGGFVKDNNDLRKIRLKTVRSHVQVDWPKDVHFKSILLEPILKRLSVDRDLWNNKIPLMVQAYFDDLWKIFNGLRPKLKLGGQAWIVVSTSFYGGIEIPVDLILAEVATNAGFNLNDIHCLRQLRTSGQQWKRLKTRNLPGRESLIILTKY